MSFIIPSNWKSPEVDSMDVFGKLSPGKLIFQLTNAVYSRHPWTCPASGAKGTDTLQVNAVLTSTGRLKLIFIKDVDGHNRHPSSLGACTIVIKLEHNPATSKLLNNYVLETDNLLLNTTLAVNVSSLQVVVDLSRNTQTVTVTVSIFFRKGTGAVGEAKVSEEINPVSSPMYPLFNNPLCYDFEIEIGQHPAVERLKVLKYVLMSRSKVFATMLASPMHEASTCVLKMEGSYDVEAVKAFFVYLYTESIPNQVAQSYSHELYGFAVKYAVPALQELIVKSIIKNLSLNNFLIAVYLAEETSNVSLLLGLLAIMKANLKDVTEDPSVVLYQLPRRFMQALLASMGNHSQDKVCSDWLGEDNERQQQQKDGGQSISGSVHGRKRGQIESMIMMIAISSCG